MSFGTLFVVAAAFAGTAPGSADSPAGPLVGVTHAVITCEGDSTLSAQEVRSICAQLVKKAQAATRLPVKSMSVAEIADGGAPAGERLVLHVFLSASPQASDRSKLSVVVTPSRDYLNLNRGAPIKSEAQLARIQGRLVVQGPVDAFGKLLGSVPPKLQQPIVSDR